NPPTISFQALPPTANCVPPTPLGGWVFVAYEEVTPLCPDALNPPPGSNSVTGCDGTNFSPQINGVGEAVFYQDYNFCNTTCDSFAIEWSACCRNGAIQSGSANDAIYTGETTVDLSLNNCNSSPTFVNKPVPYICAGQTFTFNQGAIDPDGDSLSYELGPCNANGNGPVGYNIGFSPAQPLGSTWNVSINSLTGDITMTPNPTGSQVVGVMCIVVKEWRNGQLIGQVVRDMQITVIPNCTTTNPQTGGIQNVTIGQDSVPGTPLSFNEARVCPGVEICFDVPVISQDTSLDYTITWNQGIQGASFTDANDPTITNIISGDEPTATFCWTPPLNADGAYFFVVSVNDDGCPVPGFNQFTIIVYVDDVLATSNGVGVYTSCNEMELVALPQSTMPSPYANTFTTFNWSGNGNLNLNPGINDSAFFHLYPAPDTYFYDLFIQDTFGCTSNIPGIVILPGGVTADAGPDVTICSNFNFPLGTPALPGQFYSWSPGTALSDPLVAQPTFSFPNTGIVQDTINYIVTVTDSVCTTVDYTTVIVNPTLQTSIFPATPTICIGDTLQLFATGNIGQGNTYLWSTGDTSEMINVAPTQNTTYSVVTFNNGCSSDEVFVTVNVQQGPPAQIIGDLRICPGSSTTLTAAGANTYVWSAGGFTQPSITITDINQDSTVSLIGFDAQGCPGAPATVVINPYEAPVSNFGAPALCEGLVTTFSDSSSSTDGLVVSWDWDFGDGNGSIDQNPDHTYANSGTYPVSLVVTTNNGCSDTLQQNIVVDPIPTVDFTFTDVCEGGPNFFVDNSTIAAGGTIVDRSWDFGDGSAPGSGTASSHVYTVSGFYNVTLTATTNTGCTNSFTKTVFVHPNPIADFEVISACQDSLVLASTSSAVGGDLDYIVSQNWNFGDPSSGASNTSNLLRPTHVYETAGTYTITLTVTTNNGCTSNVQREVEVFPAPAANFTVADQCENTATQFLDNSQTNPATPGTAYWWDLGEGTTGTTQDFAHFFNRTAGPGTYTVTHAITTTAGCVDTIREEVIIFPAPQSRFQAAKVCFGDTMQFMNRTEIVTGEVVSYLYDFADGTTSPLEDPEHFYAAPGQYLVNLTAVSDLGCTNSWDRTVEVFDLPNITQITEDSICFGAQAFLVVSTLPDVSVRWYANVDDQTPFFEGNAYVTPPLPFGTTYFVEPVGSELGCVNTRQPVNAYIYDAEELEILADNDVLELPLSIVNFSTASSIGLSEYQWSFGDGNTSILADPSHEYQFPGKFVVSLKAVDANGCEIEATRVIEVKKIFGVSLPSAFSPNDDGVNDTYRIGYNNIDDFQIQIFNRWGQKVYESQSPDFEWNGRDKDQQAVQEGVYVFMVQYTDLDGNSYDESRTITLIR
ncbi:MAG: PKD domain-containing protein, partial [Bacteroidota bacterium]